MRRVGRGAVEGRTGTTGEERGHQPEPHEANLLLKHFSTATNYEPFFLLPFLLSTRGSLRLRLPFPTPSSSSSHPNADSMLGRSTPTSGTRYASSEVVCGGELSWVGTVGEVWRLPATASRKRRGADGNENERGMRCAGMARWRRGGRDGGEVLDRMGLRREVKARGTNWLGSTGGLQGCGKGRKRRRKAGLVDWLILDAVEAVASRGTCDPVPGTRAPPLSTFLERNISAPAPH